MLLFRRGTDFARTATFVKEKKQTNSTKKQQSTLLHSPTRRRKRNMNIRNHRNQGPIAICLALL